MNCINQPVRPNALAFYTLISLFFACLCIIGCTDQQDLNDQASVEAKSNETSMSQELDLNSQELTCSEPIQGWNPNGVHKMNSLKQFEGWYYRVTETDSAESWVVIAAYWQDESATPRAFIELIQASTGATYKQVFEGFNIEALQANEGEFALDLDGLFLSADQISGRFIDEKGAQVQIEISIDACAYWGAPADDRNRWTMGWVTELPGPPLKWHVHHLKGSASGGLLVEDNNELKIQAQFEDAPVHQEKNWGVAFPKRWVWLQSNLFEGRPDVAFAAAGGPVFGFDGSPSGYMMGLRWRDQFFNWRTQDAHIFKQVAFEIDREQQLATWRLSAESLRYKADIEANAPLNELIAVDVPAEGGLAFGAFEHLNAELKIKLYQRRGVSWTLIDELKSSRTAVEAGGEFAESIVEVLGQE